MQAIKTCWTASVRNFLIKPGLANISKNFFATKNHLIGVCNQIAYIGLYSDLLGLSQGGKASHKDTMPHTGRPEEGSQRFQIHVQAHFRGARTCTRTKCTCIQVRVLVWVESASQSPHLCPHPHSTILSRVMSNKKKLMKLTMFWSQKKTKMMPQNFKVSKTTFKWKF